MLVVDGTAGRVDGELDEGSEKLEDIRGSFQGMRGGCVSKELRSGQLIHSNLKLGRNWQWQRALDVLGSSFARNRRGRAEQCLSERGGAFMRALRGISARRG